MTPRSAAWCRFARWGDDGTGRAIHDLVRWRAGEGRPGLSAQLRPWPGPRTSDQGT